ncbi:proline-rich extensin-like protein EPR1 isoform X2 [Hyposmocoma kahamanoa]|nr:proline-rich extensin-like protein EPR1 isoform X2 [Hyposmocoma kahamanoa]XP_026316814.1 proline-rich extensin-like protein EPR1 isoform X2 [Hyposmocoma kahamanoa]
MAPHSPQRGAPPPHAPPPYQQPPPPYVQPPPHQWPVAPPNVYVSQVTANVNVHGYMGQYYQPPQPQYVPPPPQVERPQRNHRRDRRAKRPPSPPPQQPPPYYLQYPQYYHPAAQAQGAPLYHMPMYQPVVYGPYAYPPYAYPEYPMPVEGEPGEKGPEEYSQEAVMEQEAVDAYYGGAHYAGPPYGPPVDGGVEYMPPMYLPPPPHPPPVHMPQPSHQSTPHQFNVYAKNFVQGQGQTKSYTPPEKTQDQKTPPASTSASAAGASADSISLKDLKISKGPGSPKQSERPLENQAKPPIVSDKSPTSKTDTAKPAWVQSENKSPEALIGNQPPLATKTFPPIASAHAQAAASVKVPPVISKTNKGPAAPFSGAKQPPKPTVPQTGAVPVQQTVSTPKAPFANRQKREGTTNRSPSSENTEICEKSITPMDHSKREQPLPPSKAPMPISITLHSQGQPLIVTNKSPFGRQKVALPEPPPIPQPPPPAPTASDFPPPPTPRNTRGEPVPQPVVQATPALGKTWASLFSSKPSPQPQAPAPEEPPSPTSLAPPPPAGVQKPVAKVSPYDASPVQPAPDKGSVAPRTTTVPVVSYSEKTSVNAVSGASASPAPKPAPAQPPVDAAAPTPKEPTPAVAVPPSPFSDDPNSYRMGEFLSKYQLDNRPVTLLPRGLTNRSNYCYVNAILQALIACPPFYNMLKALPYQTRRGKSSTPVIDSMVELCYEFSPIAPGARNTRGSRGEGTSPVVPAGPPLEGGAGLKVLRALRPFPGSQEGRQEDAEEFLGCLLNSLNDEMLELMKLFEPDEPKEATGQPNGVITQEQPQEEDDDDDEWKVMGPRNRGAVERRWAARRTPVADIFRGRTRTRLHRAAHAAPHLHDVTDAVQPFFTLQLDIERANSVKDALELLAGKDTLEGVSDAWQQLSIEQLPVVLLLHLKCFQLDSEGHTAKIVKSVDFPIDLKIDPKIMASKMKYTSKQRLYKLFAVVYHEGVEAVKGHYLTDTYHGQAGWIRYDDSTVNQVTDAQVLKPKPPRMPYLLMYRRQDTLPIPHRAAGKPE